MLVSHEKTIKEKELLGAFKSITMADRNYKSLSYFYNKIKK